jgi:hypothetical protein
MWVAEKTTARAGGKVEGEGVRKKARDAEEEEGGRAKAK